MRAPGEPLPCGMLMPIIIPSMAAGDLDVTLRTLLVACGDRYVAQCGLAARLREQSHPPNVRAWYPSWVTADPLDAN
jgi:hypothetical protein